MAYNLRSLSLVSLAEAKRQLEQIGCDPVGVALMTEKMLLPVLKLEGLSTKAANLLKQTFLAKGGDVAVSRGTADLSEECTDVLVFATVKQYRLALAQLKQQPWGLPRVAAAMEQALKAHLQPTCQREYAWQDGKRLVLTENRTLVMGILNVTPDSFSDGGRYFSAEAAIEQAQRLVEEGADIIDLGAESTRPYGGNQEISAEIELSRMMPVLERLVKQVSVPISIDTYKAEVAEASLQAGAHIINDVWGLQHDPDIWQFAYDKKILLISPTNLIAALKLIVDLWKREYQNRNAIEIAERGAKLYDKFVGFIANLERVGRNIDQAQNAYNDAYKQLSTGNDNLVLQTQKLKDLGVKAKKELPPSLLEE